MICTFDKCFFWGGEREKSHRLYGYHTNKSQNKSKGFPAGSCATGMVVGITFGIYPNYTRQCEK